MPSKADLEIVGHRGAAHDAPENTLASVRLGWEQGADAVEIDVHLSRDKKIVVCHDADTRRVAGVNLAIAGHDADDLRRLDVGRWKAPQYQGERIPLLEEVLATIPPGKRLLIEVKCGAEVVPILKGVLASSGLDSGATAILSFHPEVIAASHLALPQVKAYWLVDLRPDEATGEWSPRLDDILAKAGAIGADGLDLSARDAIDVEYHRRVREAGLALLVWTVNDPALARRMVTAGVRSITTDRPGWLREQLSTP